MKDLIPSGSRYAKYRKFQPAPEQRETLTKLDDVEQENQCHSLDNSLEFIE